MIDYSKIYVNDFVSYDKNGNARTMNSKFKDKMMYAKYETKSYYNDLKNIFLRYGFKDKYTAKFETFKKGDLLFRFHLNRSSLKLYMDIPTDYVENHLNFGIKYSEDKKSLEKTPFYIRLKSNRSLKYAKEMLLDLIKLNNFRENKKYNDINYLPMLIPNGEVIMRKLGLKDYYLYDDITLKNIPRDIPYDFINYIPKYLLNEGQEKVFATVYIDDLCDEFDDYDVVNIDSVKELGLASTGNALRVKARGKIDKKLIIFADEFDDDALRMIVHTNSVAILVD